MIFEAHLEICMLGFAVSTFVVGLFGKNVINYIEESAYAFAVLIGASVMGTTRISRWAVEAEQISQGAVLSLIKAQLV